jgi:CHASE2 domain-containing sensor protein/nitrogen-specific signal transduction histidine kinase
LNAHLQRKTRLRREWFVTIAISVSLLAFLVFGDVAKSMGNVLYDHLMRLHGFKPNPDIVIVAVDDRSLSELGGWPLRRDHYTQLLHALDDDRYRPKVIGFDFLFLDRTPDDVDLANAMQRFHTVLPLEFRIQEDHKQTLRPTLPVEPLATAAHIGHINLSFDSDGVIRGIRLFEQSWPHFALQLHEPSTQTGYRRFRMVDPRIGFPVVSLTDAIHDNLTRSLLKDKYVLVGVTAPSLGDRYPTLYSGKNNASTPGVAILASVLNASLNQALISEAPHWVVFGLALVPLFIMLFSLVRMRPSYALILAACMMVCGVAISDGLLTFSNYWVDPVPFILVALILQPLWAWRRLEAIVHFVEDQAAALQQFQPTERADPKPHSSREVVLQYAKLLDQAVTSARSELDFLAAVIDEMPDAVAIFDTNDQLLLSNQKIKQLIGNQHLDVGTDLSQLAQQLHIATGSLMGRGDTALIRPNTASGQQEFFLKTTSLQSPTGGNLRLVILSDVTELRQSQTQRDRALQFLSHDMRTPVASILSLTRRGSDPAELEAQRHKIVHHANALLNMMDDFILTVSSEAPQYQFKQELLDNLLNDAIEQVADLAEARNIRLIEHNEASDIFIMANTRLLVRALVNLLFNAVKFSPSGSSIEVHVTTTLGSDGQACGVTLTLQNSVDQHATPDLTPSMPGFGLGLHFVDTVIHKHQGTISRHIPASGVATITVTLPCSNA